jgi:hypothetical protein
VISRSYKEIISYRHFSHLSTCLNYLGATFLLEPAI